MSTSRHPIAYRLEGLIGGQAKLLATVMALPLVDGIFAALIIAGALDTPLRIIETGLLIFGGSATMAVILAEMDGTPRDHVESVLVLGAILIPVAAAEAAVAPTIESLLNLVIFERFAALVILAVAAKTASSQLGDLLPSPGTIIGLGLLASLQPSGLSLVVQPDLALMARAGASAGVGVGFALAVAVAGPRLRGRVDLDRFRFGSAVALGMLAVTVLEFPGVPTDQPIALYVLLVTAVLSYDTGTVPGGAADEETDDGQEPPAVAAEQADEPAGDAPTTETPRPAAGGIDPVETATQQADAASHGHTAAEQSSPETEPSNDAGPQTTGEASPEPVDVSQQTTGAPAQSPQPDETPPEADDGSARTDDESAPADGESEQADDESNEADDESEQPRQADEEYGQSRAPWL